MRGLLSLCLVVVLIFECNGWRVAQRYLQIFTVARQSCDTNMFALCCKSLFLGFSLP